MHGQLRISSRYLRKPARSRGVFDNARENGDALIRTSVGYKHPSEMKMAIRAEMDTNEETVRLLAALIRMQSESQSHAISELSKAGIGPSRIAELLGTSAGTVNVALQRAKGSAKKSKAAKKRDGDRG